MVSLVARAVLVLVAALFMAAPTFAFSASQVEALTDPSHADPYTFPNVKPCCGVKPDPCANNRCRPPKPRPCWSRPSGCGGSDDRVYIKRVRDCTDRGCGPRPQVPIDVFCDGSGEFQSIQAAIDFAETRYGGREATIYVHGGVTGPTCRGPIRINGNIRVTGATDRGGFAQAVLETGPGTCLTVSGSRSIAHITNLDIISDTNGACIESNGGRVHLGNVNVTAPNSMVAIALRDTEFSASGVSVVSGGQAVSAKSSSVTLSQSRFIGRGLYAYGAWTGGVPVYSVPGNYPQPGYPPLRYLVDDLDAAYGGGRMPEANPWPTDGSGTYQRPHPYPQPYPGPSPYPYPPTSPYPVPPPVSGYPISVPGGAVYPALVIDGSPVIALDGSMAEITSVNVEGGTIGIAAMLSNVQPRLTVRLRGVRIAGNKGKIGLLAMSNVGWGQAAWLIADQGLTISGYRTGIELKGAAALLRGATVKDVDKGLVFDALATGLADGNSFTYDDDCRCIGNNCGRSDYDGRFKFRGNSCTSD